MINYLKDAKELMTTKGMTQERFVKEIKEKYPNWEGFLSGLSAKLNKLPSEKK